MKFTLPDNHCLPAQVLENEALLPVSEDAPSITDIQYDALEAGVGNAADLLISAPTSTGKTLIGWWAAAAALNRGSRVVYLVSYRALAAQKFEEAKRIFLSDFLLDDEAEMICATGDSVEDASGRKTGVPLGARFLVATYEKFLGCLSTGGPPRDLTDITFICDEVQLIGDEHRGQNVELLLTLLKRSSWDQFIGLSAVLSQDDAAAISDWLGLTLVRNPGREKQLTIECRTPNKIYSIESKPQSDPEWRETDRLLSRALEIDQIIREQFVDKKQKPVIVFCMKVDDTINKAIQLAKTITDTRTLKVPHGVDLDRNLAACLARGVAFHNAELSEDERFFVEQSLSEGGVGIVFATSTLAAGVNFPLGSAAFLSWKRWNFNKKRHEPISRAEFQNMAGRVGRMGQTAENARVILSASSPADAQIATALMDLNQQDELGDGIEPEDFGPLVLQMFAGQLCNNRPEAFALLQSTLSAARESSRNLNGVEHWKAALNSEIDRLVAQGCLVESGGNATVTALGQAIARTGLKPETANYFIAALSALAAEITNLLPRDDKSNTEDDFTFILIHAALASPEYGYLGGKPTRFVNWRISQPNLISNSFAERLDHMLFSRPWTGNVPAANGALLVTSWASGMQRQPLEAVINSVRLGTIQGLARDVAWILSGISEILTTITSPTLAPQAKPQALNPNPEIEKAVRALSRSIRRQASRIAAGLPSDVLWLTSLDLAQIPRRISRPQILALKDAGLASPACLMDGNKAASEDRIRALGVETSPQIANGIRDAARNWKINDRKYYKKVHLRRAELLGVSAEIENLYAAKGDEFEDAFEAILSSVSINFEKLDNNETVSYPDFKVFFPNQQPLIFELKTKVSETDFVNFNKATEVLKDSELIGFRDNFCVTLCNPAVDPSVPALIEACGRLSVVSASDLAEAALRILEARMTIDDLYNWLTKPGIAQYEDLPFKT